MKRVITISLAFVLATIIGVAIYIPVAEAQQYMTTQTGGRGGTWEFILPLTYTDSATIKGTEGTNVDLNGEFGLGFGFGYNINDHFQINGIFSWAYRNYEAKIMQTDGTTKKYNSNMDTATISLNGIYYFLPGKITPFVSGGIGWTRIDTNIPTGLGTTTCWWDPWYGYVCNQYVPTKTQDAFSYNAGLGVRWDISRSFALQGSYNKMWIDISNVAGGTPDFDVYKIDFIFRM
jgi:hypothetical protein